MADVDNALYNAFGQRLKNHERCANDQVANLCHFAIVGTRAIVNLLYGGKRVKKLSI
jgi:hypothetical protein